MELIIHDLSGETLNSIYNVPEDVKIISKKEEINECIGCFGCWIKTPGQCVIKDDYQQMGQWIASSDTMVIISKCQYGCYSYFIKSVLDRSISYIHPYFEKRNGQVHHRSRYEKRINVKVIFYGSDLSNQEKEIAKQLVTANGINWNAQSVTIEFMTLPKEEEA